MLEENHIPVRVLNYGPKS